ncbi:phage integrase SAM-like domain-containing protein [Galbibacter sp. BG1]
MATIQYRIRSNKNPSNLYIRFRHGRSFDVEVKTNILINPEHWNSHKQEIKNVKGAPHRIKYNNILSKLRSYVIDQFVLDYSGGIMIDSEWLKLKVLKHFNQPDIFIPNQVDKSRIYLYDFAVWWMENKSKNYISPQTRKRIGKRSLQHYDSFIIKIEEFDKLNGKQKLLEITKKYADNLKNYLFYDKDYAPSTVNRNLTRLRFFVERARDEGINIPQSFRIVNLHEDEGQKALDPYFNDKELDAIYNYDFSDNPTLDDARDNLIIGCYTCLRVSDYLKNLTLSNFKDNLIEIQTQKTGNRVTLPIHPRVKEILKKRNGNLPPKVADATFNRQIKIVAKKVGLTEEMYGGLMEKESKRKIFKMYPKYKLVSSHIARRSFATNHFGKIPNIVLMKIGGWKSEEMMLRYLKTSSREFAKVLENYWNEKTA